MKVIRKYKFNVVMFAYAAYALYVSQSMIRWVVGIAPLRVAMIYSALFLISLVFICSIKYLKLKEFFVRALFIVLGLITYFTTGDSAFFHLAIFLSIAGALDFTKVIRTDLAVKLVMLVVVMVLYFLGLTERVVMETKAGAPIYGFGFGNPNTFGVYVFGICADLIYLNYERKNWLIYAFVVLIALFINVFCDSRSSFICILFLIATSFINPPNKEKKIARVLLSILPVFFFCMSIVLVKMYDSGVSIAVSLNSVLSQRVALASVFLETYRPSLFGNHFVDYNSIRGVSVRGVLDNAYIMLITKYGVVVTIVFLSTLVLRIYRTDEKNYRSIFGIITFAVFGLMENGLCILFYNPFLLSMSMNAELKEGKKNESHAK